MDSIPNATVVQIRKPHKNDVVVLTIKCPYCNKKHSHGGGNNKKDLLLGHRDSHCINPPKSNKGYNLVT